MTSMLRFEASDCYSSQKPAFRDIDIPCFKRCSFFTTDFHPRNSLPDNQLPSPRVYAHYTLARADSVPSDSQEHSAHGCSSRLNFTPPVFCSRRRLLHATTNDGYSQLQPAKITQATCNPSEPNRSQLLACISVAKMTSQVPDPKTWRPSEKEWFVSSPIRLRFTFVLLFAIY